MRSVTAALGIGLAALAFGGSCAWQSQSDCHREMVERFGCCPTCDGECRSAITEACAEIHDTPLQQIDEADTTEDEDESEDESGDDRPAPR